MCNRNNTSTGILKTVSAILCITAALLISGLTGSYAQVIEKSPEELRAINIEEHFGEKIPFDLTFTADDGKVVKLGEYFNQGKPVILILGYYTCPMLCNLVLNGISEAVKEMPWLPGREFQMLTVSIDPRDSDVLAAAKKKTYLGVIGKPGIENGWIFFTGEKGQSHTLADALGMRYYYDAEEDQYAHGAAIFVLTEDGTISQYFYGIQFKARDLRFALMEASEGKIGNAVDKILLYCYHYDPQSGSYTIFAGNVMRLGGAITLVVLVIFLGLLWIRERRKKARAVTADKM